MKRYAPIVILIIFWFVFFWRQIGGGEVWYCCDNLLVNIPSKVFLSDELKQGRFPLTNPYIFSGTPFFADINLALLHPLNLLSLVLPPFRALSVGILIAFIVGMTGMYVFGGTLRLGNFASLIGAVVFGFSGSLIVYANNIPILQVAVLVPWVLAFWIRYLERVTGRDLVLFVLIASFQVFSGHPQLTYYTWLLLLAYMFTIKPGFQVVKLGFKAALLVLLVSSVQVIPFLEFVFHSTRVGRDFAFATAGSVHPLSLVRLILPGITGNLAGGTAWVGTGSIHGYVGFLPLLLLPLAWKTNVGRFFITISIISILMAMGKYTPVFWLAYHVVPGTQWFREPSQFLFFWGFGVAANAMIAVDEIIKERKRLRYILMISLVFLFAAGVISGQGAALWDWLLTFSFLPARLLQKLSALGWSERSIIMNGLGFNLALIGASGVLTTVAIPRLGKLLFARFFLLLLLFADLFIYGQTNLTTIPESVVIGWQQETRARIASWNLSDGRYYTDPALYPYPEKKPYGQFNDPGESAWQFTILRPSLGMLYDLKAVDGYASMVNASYQRRFGGYARDPTGVVISSIVNPELAVAGVRYILTKPNNPLLTGSTRYRMLNVDRGVAVYEDREADVVKEIIGRTGIWSVTAGLVLTLIGLGWCVVTYVKETG